MEQKILAFILYLNKDTEFISDFIGNGCIHGFKPAKDCKNLGCEKAKMHRWYDEIVDYLANSDKTKYSLKEIVDFSTVLNGDEYSRGELEDMFLRSR